MHVISDYLAKKDTVYPPIVNIIAQITKQLGIRWLKKNVCNLFLGVNMLDFDANVSDKNLEVMIFDSDVIGTRSHLWSNHEFYCPFIVFMNCD